jgi:hypothetical protein
VFVGTSQRGRGTVQSPSSSHPDTQIPAVASQRGVPPLHRVSLVAEHWPQEPFGWQAGAPPGH